MLVDDHVVELQVTMGETHAVEVGHAAEDLLEGARHFLLHHLARHDNGKQIERRVLHDLVPVASFLDDVQRLDDVAVMERRPNAKFRRHLLGIFLQSLPRVAIAELLHRKGHAVAVPLQQADGPAGPRPEHLA